jgi:hypothetical protein
MAASNKCLAQSNKSRTGVPATNKRPAARRNSSGRSQMSQAQTKHTGEMMFQKFITVFIVTAAIAFAASGLPLSSIFGAGFGSGFFNLPLIF